MIIHEKKYKKEIWCNDCCTMDHSQTSQVIDQFSPRLCRRAVYFTQKAQRLGTARSELQIRFSLITRVGLSTETSWKKIKSKEEHINLTYA